MRNIRANKGITLIALVITIIVLLILAAVSIATLTGENGILTKANMAKNQTIEAEEKEQINLAYTTVMADKLHNGKDMVVTAEELQAELDKQNAGATVEKVKEELMKKNARATVEENSNPIKVTFNKSGNVYFIDGGTGEITGPENSGNQEPEEQEFNTATTVEDAIKQDKPFEDERQITDSDSQSVIIPAGFKIAKDSSNTIVNGIVIEGRNGNQFVWVPVENIEDFERKVGYYMGSQQSNDLAKYTEPFANGYSAEQAEYNAMYDSVKNNKGFYIGRFEAGKDSAGNVVVKKGANVYNNIPWGNTMNDIEGTTNTGGKVGAVKLSKEFASKNGYQGVTSTLCYGVQWDAAMQFMDSRYITSSCGESSYVRNSAGRGHYDESALATTGSNQNYAEKNIYDMAGNVMEWTMEAYNTDNRVLRGGGYNNFVSYYSASSRYTNNQNAARDSWRFSYSLILVENQFYIVLRIVLKALKFESKKFNKCNTIKGKFFRFSQNA